MCDADFQVTELTSRCELRVLICSDPANVAPVHLINTLIIKRARYAFSAAQIARHTRAGNITVKISAAEILILRHTIITCAMCIIRVGPLERDTGIVTLRPDREPLCGRSRPAGDGCTFVHRQPDSHERGKFGTADEHIERVVIRSNCIVLFIQLCNELAISSVTHIICVFSQWLCGLESRIRMCVCVQSET